MSARTERQMGVESHYSSKKNRVFVRAMTGHYKLKDELGGLRARTGSRKGNEIKFIDGPQAYSRHYVEPEDGITQTLHIHLEEYGPGGKSQKHGHVNEAAFYILDGKGYEIHDGIRYDWQAGDIAVVHNNCVHQHFNADPAKPARALVLKTKPMYMFLNMLFQHLVEPRPTEPAPGGKGFEAREAIGEAPAPRRGVPVRRGRPRLRPAPGLRRGDHRHLPLEATGGSEALRVGSGGRDLHSTQHDPSAFQRGSTASRETHLRDQPHLQILRIERPRAIGGRAGVRLQGRAQRGSHQAISRGEGQGARLTLARHRSTGVGAFHG